MANPRNVGHRVNDESEYQTVTTTRYEPKIKKWITRTAEYQGGITMAVAGAAKPARLMRIEENRLVSEDAGMRQGTINNIDLAVHRLLAGEAVYVQSYAPVVDICRAPAPTCSPQSSSTVLVLRRPLLP